MKNRYEVRGEETAIFLNSPKHGRIETLISTDKLSQVQTLSGTWYAWWNKSTKSFYSRMDISENGKRSAIYLHRFIVNCPKELQVDHFDNDTLNNTNGNLRVATHAENDQNRKGAYCTSKSGVRGVCWDRRRRKWVARVTVGWKQKHIGYFDDITQAEKAVKAARSKLMPFSKDAI